MKHILGFLLCMLLISCSPAPKAGDSYRHGSTDEVVKVSFVGKPDEIQKFIADEESRLSEPGHTPNFEVEHPAGDPDPSDDCVVYSVVTPYADPSRPPHYEYFIYPVRNFTKAFSKAD